MLLRKYQSDTAAHSIKALAEGARSLLVVSPTGSGKSVIGAAICSGLATRRVLWLAHRVELINQAVSELLAAGIPECDVGVFTSKKRQRPDARIQVASIGMLQRHEAALADLIVIDEAHRSKAASYGVAISDNPNAAVLGLTATPWRLDGAPLGDVFDTLHVAAGPTELIAEGYLATPIVYGVPLSKARELVKDADRGGGEYNIGKVSASMSLLVGDTVSEWRRHAGDLPTIAFAVNHAHAQTLHARLRSAGIRAEYMSKRLIAAHAERAAMLARLQNGTTQVVVNVDVLSEGFDAPAVKCIICCRPTKSLTKFLQQVGRGLRPYNEQRAIILDHAGNCWRFGLPQEEREWSLTGRAKAIGGIAQVKRCPHCEAMISVGFKSCPECGQEQPVNETELTESAEQLERMRMADERIADARVKATAIAAERGFPPEWVERVVSAVGGAM